MSEELTSEEQEAILMTAEGYIREPESWIRGKWKCKVSLRDPENPRKVLRDEEGKSVPATDTNGRPLFQYCIEGAVNQAAIDVLGRERAKKFGASSKVENDATKRLGLDAIAEKLYGVPAMSYNDSPESTHEGVLRILRTGLRNLRRRTRR